MTRFLPLLLVTLLAVPVSAASYTPCDSSRTFPVAGYSVTYGLDASPCAAVEVVRPGVCFDVLWGFDLGILVVGGRDTCQTLVKVDADGCREWCAVVALP